MKYIKEGVQTPGIGLELLDGIIEAVVQYTKLGQSFKITSLHDGKHRPDSFHYQDLAVDIRTRDLGGITAASMANKIREALPPEYDVIAEKDHIHIEYDAN